MKILRLFGKNAPRHVDGNKLTQPTAEARNTSLKIDAIESAMSAEFGITLMPDDATLHHTDATTAAIGLSQCIEEAAILFASEQPDAALALLSNAITTPTGEAQDQLAWWMLFDLCQLGDRQAEFEQLALAYASRFETSPPQWNSKMMSPALVN